MKSDARRAQRGRTLGPNAACVLCGYRTPEALLQRPYTLLEAHHVCARANDPELTVVLCRNCHAEVTERQRVAGVSFGTPGTLLHQLLGALVSLAVFLLDLGQRMQTWTVALQAFLARLDQELPTWRTWPEAQPWGGVA